MKKISNSKKNNFFKKIFIKICRKFGFELIDQSNLSAPTLKRNINQSLSALGEKNISIPLGEIKISRPVQSLDIIIKTCTSVNLVTQNKKRIFEKTKSEYTFRTIKSILTSLHFDSEIKNKIQIKIYILDHKSSNEDLVKIKNIFNNFNANYEIINLDIDKFKKIKTISKNNPEIENNMKATMASILSSFYIAKEKCSDLIYFVEDDYIHKKESFPEMLKTYEKISSIYETDFFLCPVDYPYLYKKTDNTNIVLGDKYHWRVVNESLLTFMTSKKFIIKYWDNFIEMANKEHSPFEIPLHSIYEKEICLSPVPSLAMHCTNINSAFGLSPNIDWIKLWNDNEI